jgi:predicted ABC-type ATPase
VPFLTVLAGPNGSGKSTLTGKLRFEGRENLLDPDAIAKRIDPANPSRAAVAAGREVILRTREYLKSGTSFSIETTLSGGGYLETMKVARDRGFVVRLVYICVGNPEKNVQRVRARFAQGGHDVPDEDIRRRYVRSLANLPAALRLAHQAWLHDNAGDEPRLVLETRDGVVVWKSDKEPEWVARVIEALSAGDPASGRASG